STVMIIDTDSVSTTYHGFGTMIAGKPEIFTGSSGLANVRLGDRVEVRGAQRGEGVFKADEVTLLGRTVEASSVGVGQTRTPTSVSTPTDDRTSGNYEPTGGRVEGTIRQINEAEGRLVIQTTDRRMITIRTYRNTPVYYRGQSYRVTNLEVGDRVRIEADPRDAQAGEISARRIDVTMSVQDSQGRDTPGTAATVTILEGRVTRTEPGLNYIYVDDGRNEVRVDMQQAEDATGAVLRAADIRSGEVVEISGSYNRTGDMFQASTVRFDNDVAASDEREVPQITRFALVTLTGTVTETLEDSTTVGFRDRETNTVVRLWVTEDFVVRLRGTTYTTAEELRVGDTAVVEAFRDREGNLIVQTMRLRNR
ncbi:MAG: DUF5666 domain-containing protein, partial [Thermoanaerobaculia bacterium]